ncbi:MAG: M3 family oligoendopeptidase [bacterium]|jgi:oligoendopeptidase F
MIPQSREFPRQFVPEEIDLGSWEAIQPLFDNLANREIRNPKELEQWLLDQSELSAVISEERALRYIAMTCDTENDAHEKAYLHYIENIDPRLKPYFHSMNEKYLACPYRANLSTSRYAVLNRKIEAEIEIYHEKNIPLETEDKKLSQRYQKICGAMTVEFDDREQTLPQMAKYLEETDRSRRQEAWEKVALRRLQDREHIDEIFDEQIKLRDQIALTAGFANYRDYAFKLYKRFDYTPEDCYRFHEAVEQLVVPLSRDIQEQRRELMHLERLRPWDTAVDPKGRPPLRPFESADQLCLGVERILSKVDMELRDQFVTMKDKGSLDLDSRKGKAPGGYQYSLDESRRPFIFMNAAGLHRDVETLLHESGHAFHCLASRHEPLLEYRDSPIEFAEVASMTMELFADDHLNEFYSEEDAARAKRLHLEGIIQILPWIARIDAFQHWIYTNPNHTRRDRSQRWLELDKRFGGNLDWTGYESVRESLWQRQLHLFVHAFYYIEYGIAQLGALQLWHRYKQDKKAAIEGYRAGLALGGSEPLPKLFETAGAKFDFSAQTIQPLVQLLEEELAQLPT